MAFNKLPANSQQILFEMVAADNPSAMLQKKFEGISKKEDNELQGIIRELKENGYIEVKWADNAPYGVVIKNSARTYEEQLKEYESNTELIKIDTSTISKIFISHRSSDKEVADLLFGFFIATGISREKIFCSSLPGNDVKEKISVEVKESLQNSCLNIAILSESYYQSAYCLNEAGILWFNDVTVIPVALPEIKHENMVGFLNDDYKIRRLDNPDDVAYIYDTAYKASNSIQSSASVITAESQKLIKQYKQLLENRPQLNSLSATTSLTLSSITTDDERIVLYYILLNKVRKVTKVEIEEWLNDKEINQVNINNAFDLLSTIGNGTVENETLKLSIIFFREITSKHENLVSEFQSVVEAHTDYCSTRFIKLWEEDGFNEELKLFIAYIVDERIESFGERWKSEGQIEDIKYWEGKNDLYSTLSSNYGTCLSFFINNRFVYESDWTKFGNVREYRIYASLKELLFNQSQPFNDELEKVKRANRLDLPF